MTHGSTGPQQWKVLWGAWQQETRCIERGARHGCSCRATYAFYRDATQATLEGYHTHRIVLHRLDERRQTPAQRVKVCIVDGCALKHKAFQLSRASPPTLPLWLRNILGLAAPPTPPRVAECSRRLLLVEKRDAGNGPVPSGLFYPALTREKEGEQRCRLSCSSTRMSLAMCRRGRLGERDRMGLPGQQPFHHFRVASKGGVAQGRSTEFVGLVRTNSLCRQQDGDDLRVPL